MEEGVRRDGAERDQAKLSVAAGDAGKGKLQLQGQNNTKKGQDELPLGVAPLLQGTSAASVQVRTSDAECFEATLPTVKKAEGSQFKAEAP